MKVNELRIGNIVFVNEEVKRELEEEEYLHCHFLVTKIEDDEVTIYSSKENIHYTEYSVKDLNLTEIIPIKLDNDWRLRFGFKKECGNFFLGDTFYFVRNDLFLNGHFLRSIEFVHQLQNLYFALVGEELVLQD